MRTNIKSFNIRVYALIIEGDHILISKELIKDEILFKFPGGGLEFGEGLIEGLQREANEELNQSLNEIEHFYTTDFFQRSTFDSKDQLISIYYTAKLSSKLVNKLKKPIKDQPLFIWKKIKDLKENDLGFSIDKKVLKMVKDLN
tara:strand:+ start:318 stop:749 length:432 start_codon:yes stop_codon:yes gene_type:complete